MEAAVSSRARPHEPTIFSEPSDEESQITRLFHAPRERVFRFFTDRETAPHVWSPNPSLVTIEKLDFFTGGQFSILIGNPDGSSVRIHGTFREVDPPRRVVNTFEASAAPGIVAVETDTFEAVGDSTRVTVRWKYASREVRDKMGMAGAGMEEMVTKMWDQVDDLLAAE